MDELEGVTFGPAPVNSREWLADFIVKRGLDEPDGRPMYAYRCTPREFADLAARLTESGYKERLSSWDIRAFVLFASEWWQRRYDGRSWSWEPLLGAVEWDDVHYPDLYEPVGRAWRWWRVDLVRLSGSTRYLGTFACQGGLPLALVGESSRVTAYLRAVLRHVARYRKFVDDSVALAQDQQRFLHPPTLRRDYVFRLAADLVDSVLGLREYLDSVDDPLAALDAQYPEWRKMMPLDLESATARQLLVGLFREASAGTQAGADFAVERFLVHTEAGWRLGARLRLPRSVEREDFQRYLGIADAELPARMHIRVAGEDARVVGLYGAGVRDGHFHLMSGDNNREPVLWDAAAVRELRLEFLAQDLLGDVTVRRGGALGELPWVFRSGDAECALAGEGTVSDRSPELLALVPAGSEPSAGEEVDATVAGRRLWRVSEPAVILTEHGTCRLNPSSEQMPEADYGLAGHRFYEFTSVYPLFRGEPRLHVAKADQVARAVPKAEVTWRRQGAAWQPHPDGFGLWEVRHLTGGVLRHHGRAGILPSTMGLVVEPRSDVEGELTFTGAEGVAVAGEGQESQMQVLAAECDVRVKLVARSGQLPPSEVVLRLRWAGGRELPVRLPFPGEGGRFLRSGEPIEGDLAVDDLYGVRATALSTARGMQFWIEGDLLAADAGLIRPVAYFRRPLRKAGIRQELALVEVDSMLRLLLGASTDSNARVSLRITAGGQNTYHTTEVRRFAATLEHDPTMTSVVVNPPLESTGAPTFQALPLSRPDLESIALVPVGPPDAPVCATLPEKLVSPDEPWLVVLRESGGVRAAPVVVGGRSWSTGTSLRDALSLARYDERTRGIDAALVDMLSDHDTQQESKWSFLTDMLLCLEGVPPAASELLSALPRCPQMLVRCLFRLDQNLRARLWQLDEELPFSWLLIKRDVWRAEAALAFGAACSELDGVVDEPEQHAAKFVQSVFEEGAERINALDAIGTDVEMAHAGGSLGATFVGSVASERDQHRHEHVRRLASEDDWPQGYTRREWAEELQAPLLLKLPILDSDPDRRRQPTLDTPVAAAWCCFLSDPTPRTPFLVKRMRAQDPGWFDIAYRVAWYQLAIRQDRARANKDA